MSFHVYVLRCADGTYYTGRTEDLDVRMGQHASGAPGGYTARRLPVKLMWSEWFQTREQARTVEAQVKSWSKAKKEALFRGDWASVNHFAKPPVRRGAMAPRQEVSASSTSARDERGGGGEAGAAKCAVPESVGPEPASSEVETRRRGSMQPAIILVRPQLAENIGKTARAMLNFGLTDLRLVAPRDGRPNPDAGPAASGADEVLAKAQLFDTLADAVADCAHVFATTVRRRDLIKPVVDPAEAAALVHAEAGRSAYVFGAERSGLSSDDVALARTILTIPINPDFGSLNLAQAVIIAAYEWSKGKALAQPPLAPLDPPAPQGELEALIETTNKMLERIDYFRSDTRRVTTLRNIRSLLTKPGWSAREVKMMRGMLRGIERGPRKGD